MFLLSIIYASFIQCLIDRYPHYLKPYFSCCDICGHRLKLTDNIPIISYFFLKGKCRYCQKKISFNKPLSEIIFLLMFIFLSYFYKSYWQLFIVFSMLYLASFTDLKYGEIPDISWIVIIIASNNFNFNHFLPILITGTILSMLNLLGFGDVKLLCALSLYISYYQFNIALFLSCFLALLFNNKKGTIIFAPYISIAYFIVILFVY